MWSNQFRHTNNYHHDDDTSQNFMNKAKFNSTYPISYKLCCQLPLCITIMVYYMRILCGYESKIYA